MPNATVQLFNTDPNVQAQAALLQQRMALAQALQGEGMKPLDTAGRQIGGVAYQISPFEGLAKMAQALSGQKMMQDTVGQQAQLAAQAYGNLLSKYQVPAAPQYSSGEMDTARQAAVPADGMGPPDPVKMGQALAGQSPSLGGGVNPNNPQGIPAQILAAHDAGMVNDETFKALVAPYAPTDATKAATQGNFSVPGANRLAFDKATLDPKILAYRQAGMSDEQINQAIAGAAQKDASEPMKPDQSLYQFSGSGAPQLRAVAPNPGDNMQFNVSPQGSVSAQPVPGAIPNKSGMAGGTAGASAAGTTANTLHPIETPGGKHVLALGKDIVPGDSDRTAIYQQEMRAAQQRLAQGDPRAQADIDGLTREMKRYGIPQGQSTADKITQEAGAKVMADLPMQLQQSKQTVVGLENAYKTIDALSKSGPGVAKSVDALGILNNLGIPVAKGDVNGYQTLKKYLENSASTAAASNGFTGSDSRFEQFKNGQPNAETMNPDALKGAIRYVLSQHDASIARAQFIQQQVQQNPNDPNAPQKAQQQWSQAYNPRVFEFSRMSPEERAKVKSSMSGDQRQKFGQQYNFAHQQGWVQ